VTLRSAWCAAAWYVAATIALTWPAAAGLTRNIPWDLGDSMLNAWILGWNADHLLRALSGDWGALHGFWTANIFGHEPLTLAYSEHLLALTVQILPVYALSGNLILCYNLLFLSTFVLSGLGTYLLVRDLTLSPRGAFIAGLVYAFALYRIGQYSHLQVISSQWMPFALFGLRRYFVHRRARALVGASAALVMQNLSCGYFLFYFSPFVLAYALFEIGSRGLWRDRTVWVGLSLAAVGVGAFTVPFLLPYLELRALGQRARPLSEVVQYSADVYSYLTAHWAHPIYGDWLRVWDKPEGELFPGLVPLALAGLGLGAHLRPLWRASRRAPDDRPRWEARLTTTVLVGAAAITLLIALSGGGGVLLGSLRLRARSPLRPLLLALVALGVAAWRSARVRAFLRGVPGSALAFYSGALAVSALLSLGPMPEVLGQTMPEAGPYMWLYRHVPGFDGLRVPARYGMQVMLFLAVLAGYGVREIEQRTRRAGLVGLAVATLVLVEANAAPIDVNSTPEPDGFIKPPAQLVPGPGTLDIYREVQRLPEDVLLAEFPFGEWSYELRYMYYSTTHWRRLLNGYSGNFPDSYIRNATILKSLPDSRQNDSWDVLVGAGVTHAIVHEGAFHENQGAGVSAWLESHGAVEVASAGRDRIFALPGPAQAFVP
jgi:hypothetical protein